MKTKSALEQCNMTERNGQVVFTLNSEIMLPEDAPVRLTNAQLEELDYSQIERAVLMRGVMPQEICRNIVQRGLRSADPPCGSRKTHSVPHRAFSASVCIRFCRGTRYCGTCFSLHEIIRLDFIPFGYYNSFRYPIGRGCGRPWTIRGSASASI